MIRNYTENYTESVLNIWLTASVKAPDFVPADFWQSQLGSMRDIYLPASDVYVFEHQGEVIGFYALYESNLAAIFVSPERQGQGFGKQLLDHAKQQRVQLTLSVYKQNHASYQFYLSQGFKVMSEPADEHTSQPEYTMSFG